MKIQLLLIVIVLVVIIAGCGSGFDIHSTHIGTVIISSVPAGAEVYINGVYDGRKTNCEFTLSAQKEQHIAVKYEGYRDYQTTFSLNANEEKKIEVVLESL